jgi:hypothetical protein
VAAWVAVGATVAVGAAVGATIAVDVATWVAVGATVAVGAAAGEQAARIKASDMHIENSTSSRNLISAFFSKGRDRTEQRQDVCLSYSVM